MFKWLFMSLLMSLLQQVPSVSALPTCNINWISPQVNTNSQFQVTWTFDLDNVGEDELLGKFNLNFASVTHSRLLLLAFELRLKLVESY